MVAKIRVLTDDTINKIAAGEVIENSASVVKELVENSLDSGANAVHVEIKGGGRQLIRVTDDGCGMHQDDALLCLERHATSKIRRVDDIEAIGTLGFRGEAIPSIASISKFTLITRPREGAQTEDATMVIVEGGRILKCCGAARAAGTTVEIKGLFFNVPARRKFQRSPAHDTSEVLKTLSSLALAHPHITFELISDQESLLKTRTSESPEFLEKLLQRIQEVLGLEFRQACLPTNHSHEACTVRGYVGAPTYTRPNRTGQHLFINGRAVISPFISHLVREAYGTALQTNRHPVFVLHLNVPGELVDVNVHPQKREVRLRQNELLKQLFLVGVGKALQSSSPVLDSFEERPSPSYAQFEFREVMPEISFNDAPPTRSYEPRPLPQMSPLPWEAPLVREISIPTPAADLFSAKPRVPKVPTVIATIRGYVLLDSATCTHVASDGSGLALLDQRAAHHRILFERFCAKVPPPIQPLLIPSTVDFSTLEAACVREAMPQLVAMGFEIEEFGQNAFLLRAVPAEFDSTDGVALLSELVEQLREFQHDGLKQLEREKKLSLSASRLAINRKQVLSMREAQGLITQLFSCDSPLQCPQGHPTIILLGERELAKQFQQ